MISNHQVQVWLLWHLSWLFRMCSINFQIKFRIAAAVLFNFRPTLSNGISENLPLYNEPQSWQSVHLVIGFNNTFIKLREREPILEARWFEFVYRWQQRHNDVHKCLFHSWKFGSRPARGMHRTVPYDLHWPHNFFDQIEFPLINSWIFDTLNTLLTTNNFSRAFWIEIHGSCTTCITIVRRLFGIFVWKVEFIAAVNEKCGWKFGKTAAPVLNGLIKWPNSICIDSAVPCEYTNQ